MPAQSQPGVRFSYCIATVLAFACDSTPADGESEPDSTTETIDDTGTGEDEGTGDGESTGDGDGDGESTGDGDGDGESTGDGDGDGDGDCSTEGCSCTDGEPCDADLVCEDEICVPTDADNCGDEVVGGTEQCDDGNLTNSDGCEDDCTLTEVLELTAGLDFSCALLGSGDVLCWGNNEFGQLGHGLSSELDIGDNETPASQALVVELGEPAISISAGSQHVCVVLATHEVRCWGKADNGRLGVGVLAEGNNAIGDDETPVAVGVVEFDEDVVEVAAGGEHTCALRMSGDVVCWGKNDDGQLGRGNNQEIGTDIIPNNAGEIVFQGGEVEHLSLGEAHSCAIFEGGDVRCWGSNFYGQLGRGDAVSVGGMGSVPVPTLEPIFLGVGGSAAAIEAGAQHTCVILSTKNIACWGYGVDGALGYDNVSTLQEFITTVSMGNGASTLGVSAGKHTCALSVAGEIKCWGHNAYGSLGYGNTDIISSPSQQMSVNLDGVVSDFAAGTHHSCALMSSGDVRCWGYNLEGQLGLGHTNNVGNDEHPFAAGVVHLF